MKPLHGFVKQVKVLELRPTQAAIGFAEVTEKREHWQQQSKRKCREELDSHWFPSVLGPGGKHYILDHHHFAMAMYLQGEKIAQVVTQKDWSALDESVFWKMLELHNMVWPYDARGKRIVPQRMPTCIDQLTDDPYRSLASHVQKAGGFAKQLPFFAEFVWADYFRQKISLKQLRHLDGALVRALELAAKPEAASLPGWVGGKMP